MRQPRISPHRKLLHVEGARSEDEEAVIGPVVWYVGQSQPSAIEPGKISVAETCLHGHARNTGVGESPAIPERHHELRPAARVPRSQWFRGLSGRRAKLLRTNQAA